jgi:hypothetical protein
MLHERVATPMLRTLFYFTAGMSLLLFVTVSIWWIRSYWVVDQWVYATARPISQWIIYTDHGWINACDDDGFDDSVTHPFVQMGIHVPFAAPVGVSIILPAAWVHARYRRQSKKSQGFPVMFDENPSQQQRNV